MKLRLRGNSLRLRLTKTEVERLAGELGSVTETVRFGPTTLLVYRLRRAEVPSVAAALEHTTIDVVVPAATIDAWASSEQVGFEADQSIGDGGRLHILVEKDWTCLTGRPGEDDVDTFPNPNTSC
jgi:hypothetical protein